MSPTYTADPAPRADRFRPGDLWRRPDGRICSVWRLRNLPSHVSLRPLDGSHHSLMRIDDVAGHRRTKWGGKT